MRYLRQQGISLLEVLLVLVVAASMVGAAVTYYAQTLTGSRVSEAVSQLQQINKAGYEWLQIPNVNAGYPVDFGALQGGQGLTLFVANNLIPCANRSCYHNPWGGKTLVTSGSGYPQYMLVVFSDLPAADCARLKEQMKNIAPEGPASQNQCSASARATSYQVYL